MPNLLVLEALDDARLLANISNAGHYAIIVGVVEMRSELLLLVEDVIDLCAELANPSGETGDLINELAETANEWAMALYVDGEQVGAIDADVRAAFEARPIPEGDEGSPCSTCPMIVVDLKPEGGAA